MKYSKLWGALLRAIFRICRIYQIYLNCEPELEEQYADMARHSCAMFDWSWTGASV